MAPEGLKGSKAKNADVSKNNINVLSLYKHWKKTDILNWNVFFANYILSRVFRGSEELSSSIWRRFIAWGELHPRVAFEGENFGQFLVYEP